MWGDAPQWMKMIFSNDYFILKFPFRKSTTVYHLGPAAAFVVSAEQPLSLPLQCYSALHAHTRPHILPLKAPPCLDHVLVLNCHSPFFHLLLSFYLTKNISF